MYLKYLFPLFQWHVCKQAKLSACIAKLMSTVKKIYFFFSTPWLNAGKYFSCRSSSVGCTPKDSISAPPVEGLYDARSSDFTNSPFRREQVRKEFLYYEK